MTQTVAGVAGRLALCSALLGLSVHGAAAAVPRRPGPGLADRQFSRPELHYATSNVPVQEVLAQLRNRGAWEGFMAAHALGARGGVQGYIDPRSGAATNILLADPVIPGSGVGNSVTLAALSERLGRPVTAVDPAVVADLMLLYVREHADVLGVLPDDVGGPTATPINPDLWQVSLYQIFHELGVPAARIAATISHGNLVTIGTAGWAEVQLASTEPRVTAEAALDAGFAFADGRTAADDVVTAPRLQIATFAPPEYQDGERFTGPVGKGYGHRLVWTFQFQRRPETGLWEVTVDAQSGEVIAFVDQNQYTKKQINGGVYPLTSTETCPDPQNCGAMQIAWPMPFADTGFPAPNEYTNSGGMYAYPGGTATTRLRGPYAFILVGLFDHVEESSTNGTIALGGTNGQHDNTGPHGPFPQDTNNPPARTAFYELNKITEIARGYLPDNAWLRHSVMATVNAGSACNAFYDSHFGSLTFLNSGPFDTDVCRNTGEIAGVVDHEWGHSLDDHDAAPGVSNPGEAYADIAAMYRTQVSCQGPGFFVSSASSVCGLAPDGSGPNVNEDQAGLLPGGPYCATRCSGVRDADWAAHSPSVASNPGFVCASCLRDSFDPGPCGREVHCAGSPVTQAAWDLATRDLTAPPFGLDRQSAFIVGSKLFYQGSGNIGSWYTCACGGSSNGCAAENAYVQWLAADDDNGDLGDGTPHAGAIFAAFDRHGIACPAFTHASSGCAAGPAAAPSLTVTPGALRATLSWTAVPGATRYWVFRTEGHAGCDYGKALLAEVNGLAYTDTEVAPSRPYSYSVVAAGTSSACYGPASTCKTATPAPAAFSLACSPSTLAIPGTSGGASTTCTVGSTGGFDTPVTLGCSGLPGTAGCAFTPASVTPPGATSVRVTALSVSPGNYPFQVRAAATDAPLVVKTAPLVLAMGADPPDQVATFDAALRAPRCTPTPGRSCDTGPTLVSGRGTLGPEPNQPNTIGGSCADGSAPVTPTNGANERIRVESVDGNPLAAGGTAVITATVTARSNFAQDAADFFFAADAQQPSWVLIGTVTPTAAGTQTLGKKYVLPAGALQAVRVQYRRGGSAAACAAGTVNDRDDLVFAVAAASLAPGESKR